jgi:transcriptional regulator with XRE-family HTH domain
MSTSTDFSYRLKCLLAEKKVSQKELAQHIGVKPNTICDWIKKGTSPKVRQLYAMAEFFEVSFDYLFTGRHDIRNPLVEELTEDEKELLTYFRKLPEREKYVQIGMMLGASKKYTDDTVENEKNAI